jgi:histidine kinase
VILKQLKESAITRDNIDQMVHEFEISHSLHSPYILSATHYINDQHYCLSFLDTNATSLLLAVRREAFTLDQKLLIAIELTKGLQYLHNNNILHKDINPDNVIYHSKDAHVMIIDFGLSSYQNVYMPKETTTFNTFGQLPYMSPEQTGKLDVAYDERSDLYGLGMTLYYLFYEEQPFSGSDRGELLHQQLSLYPKLKDLLNISQTIQDIINLLIQKVPSARYQSVESLLLDLQYASINSTENGEITPFILNEHPARGYLRLNSLFVGRQVEISQVKSYWDDTENTHHLLVSGTAGVGKSAFAQYVANHIYIRNNSIVIRAKFEETISTPYWGFYLLFKEIFTILWRKKETSVIDGLRIHLHEYEEVLLSVFPIFDGLFTQTLELKTDYLQDFNQRLLDGIYQFLDFFRNNSKLQLTIIIDDLQWADSASLDVLQYVMIKKEIVGLPFILTYRDNEISQDSKNGFFIKNLSIHHARLFVLDNLLLEHIYAFISEEFKINASKCKVFSLHIFQKSAGNPFYFLQLLGHLIEEKILFLENEKWDWNEAKLRSISVSINVLSLVHSRLEFLDKESILLAQYLACFGFAMHQKFVQYISNKRNFNNRNSIKALLNKNIIYIVEKEYYFSHDKLQEAFYQQLSNQNREKFHYEIAHYLIEADANKGKSSFEIAEHLSKGFSYCKTQKERNYLYDLMMNAVTLLIHSRSYTKAKEILFFCEEHLIDKCSLQKSFTFYLQKANIHYLCNEHTKSLSILDKLNTSSITRSQQVALYSLFKSIRVTMGSEFEIVMDRGVTLLQMYGVILHLDPEASLQNKLFLDKKIKNSEVFATPLQESNKAKRLNKSEKELRSLLVDMWESAYYQANLTLMSEVYLTLVSRSLKYGNSSESAFGYVLYGSQLIDEGLYRKAYQFGKLSLSINRQFNDVVMLPKVHNFVANFILPYVRNFNQNIALYEKSLIQSKRNGDIVFGIWANFLMMLSRYFAGENLVDLSEQLQNHCTFLDNSGDEKLIAIKNYLHTQIINLTQENEELIDEVFLVLFKEQSFVSGIVWFGILKAEVYFMKGEYLEAYEVLNTYAISHENSIVMFAKGRLHALRALLFLLLQKERTFSNEENLTYYEDKSLLKVFSRSSAKNYKVPYLLLLALEKQAENKPYRAAEFYEQAIDYAKINKHGYYQAITYYLSYLFWYKQTHLTYAEHFLSLSISAYEMWGAHGMASYLATYHQRHSKKLVSISSTLLASENSISFNRDIDYQSMIKMLHTISEVEDQTSLLKKTFKILAQIALAQKGVLIFQKNNLLSVVGEVDFTIHNVTLSRYALEESNLPIGLIKEAVNQKSLTIYNDPLHDNSLVLDKYLARQAPQSILILPIEIQNEISSVLYLEHSELKGVFETLNIELLEFLMIEVSSLFKNRELLDSLRKTQEQLQSMNDNLELEVSQKLETIRAQDNMLIQQSKMALIGEMTTAISHQWRQPLSALSLKIQDVQDAYNYGELDDAYLEKLVNSSMEQIQFMSRTIEDFRNFFTPSREQEEIYFYKLIKQTLALIESSFNEHGIEVSLTVDPEITCMSYGNELQQVLLNILTNAKDALVLKGKKSSFNKVVKITLSTKKEHFCLEISNNGGAIPLEVIEKMYQPYFTTKFESQGTGIGLYMCKTIVTQHLQGEISAKNSDSGVSFFIMIPKELKVSTPT